MDEFFKSAARCYWATALFGARQLGEASSLGGAGRATEAFDSVTHAAEAQLGGVLRTAFRAGDQLQRGLWDLTYGVLGADALTPRGMTRATLNAMRQSAGVLGQLVPGAEARAALQEFQNKLQVFDLFEHADAVLRLPPGGNVPLSELATRAYGLDSFLAVWATEGVGHYYTESVWPAGGAPDALLKGAAARGVHAESMAALHAGMGLSLANRQLAAVRRQCTECPAGCELREALRRFGALCRANSAEGYVGATYEALGLVARNLYPHLVACIDRHLSEMGRDSEAGGHLAEFFWHGVGRAIYFAPTNYLPVGNTLRRAFEMSRREPPHEAGQRNAVAGVAWAMLLVNLRQPEIIENFLARCGDGTLDGDAFANGVSSAAVIWRDSAERDPHLEALCRHRPDSSRPGLAERWSRFVKTPCLRALTEYYDALKSHGRIGAVFCYQPLPGLVRDLEEEGGT